MADNVEVLETKEDSEPTFYQKWFGRSKLYEVEVILFGFAAALGNLFTGFAYRYDTVWINLLIIGSSFICLSFCLGEMTSALPFSGGIFGFVRAASGPYYGFVVACFEVFFCLVVTVAVITQYTVMVPLATGYIDASFQSRLICIFFGLNLFINLFGGSPFWIIVNLLGFAVMFFLVVYLFGILLLINNDEIDYKTFCEIDQPILFDPLMLQLTTVLSQFQGLQFLPLLSKFTVEPRKSIPRAMIVCSITAVVLAICVSFAACSTSPGQMIVQMVPMPLIFGFQVIFKVNTDISLWLNFPALYGASLMFCYCSSRQLYMIAKSGFLPSFFTYKTPQTGTPIVTLFVTTGIGIAMSMILMDYPDYVSLLFCMINLCTYIIFLNAFIAYLLFKKKYSSLSRLFQSPVGKWGGYLGIGINLLGLTAEFKYKNEDDVKLAGFILAVVFGCATIFYWVYLVRNQKFSEEEKKLMFKAYLINANRGKRLRILRNNRVGSVSTTPQLKARNNSACSGVQSKLILDIFSQKFISSLGQTAKITEHNEHSVKVVPAPLPATDHYSAIRPEETVDQPNSENLQAKSVSEKLVQFVSEKMNGMSSKALQEYERLAILSSGGILEVSAGKPLEEQTGFNDIEQQQIVTSKE